MCCVIFPDYVQIECHAGRGKGAVKWWTERFLSLVSMIIPRFHKRAVSAEELLGAEAAVLGRLDSWLQPHCVLVLLQTK